MHLWPMYSEAHSRSPDARRTSSAEPWRPPPWPLRLAPTLRASDFRKNSLTSALWWKRLPSGLMKHLRSVPVRVWLMAACQPCGSQGTFTDGSGWAPSGQWAGASSSSLPVFALTPSARSAARRSLARRAAAMPGRVPLSFRSFFTGRPLLKEAATGPAFPGALHFPSFPPPRGQQRTTSSFLFGWFRNAWGHLRNRMSMFFCSSSPFLSRFEHAPPALLWCFASTVMRLHRSTEPCASMCMQVKL
mmetsp:Transcript_85933/g.243739  ORF Transcript_85933/g.243739 Transcript_85933/m.243739 type:complete len:246 (+) Transcript_85933:217-954(+)